MKYRVHTQKYHTNKWQCNICKRSFKSEQTLKIHTKRIHDQVWKCDICDEVFARRTYREAHIKSNHNESKNLSCEHCGKLYANEAKLKIHIHVITDKK